MSSRFVNVLRPARGWSHRHLVMRACRYHSCVCARMLYFCCLRADYLSVARLVLLTVFLAAVFARRHNVLAIIRRTAELLVSIH